MRLFWVRRRASDVACVHHAFNDGLEDDLHGESHLAAGHDDGVAPGHEGAVDHRQQVGEVDFELPGIAETDDHEALVRGGNVAGDERVRGVHRRHTLEVDVGARELGVMWLM